MKGDYIIYFLVSSDKNSTYLGYTNNIQRRIREHKNHNTKTTKYFGNFRIYILDRADNVDSARLKEKYWKSHTGRKKLKRFFENL